MGWAQRANPVAQSHAPRSLVAPGTWATYPALQGLPPLVRRQRRLEAKIAPLALQDADEKILRKEIDALLITAGLAKNEKVTCLGYDVTHRARDGKSALNAESIVAKLVAGGVDKEFALQVLKDSTETGDEAQWAEVRPSKGATVRVRA